MKMNAAAKGPGEGKQPALKGAFAAAPAIGVALLPKLTCPVCWPAYAALLGSLGAGFVNYTPYLAPLTVLFMAAAVAPMGFGVKQRQGYGPLALGLISAVVVVMGKFVFDSDIAMYAGLFFLIAATAWNIWPRKKETSCPMCAKNAEES